MKGYNIIFAYSSKRVAKHKCKKEHLHTYIKGGGVQESHRCILSDLYYYSMLKPKDQILWKKNKNKPFSHL